MKIISFLSYAILAGQVLAIKDPFNIFCGSSDCYEVLGLDDRTVSVKDIKKAYRKLSIEYHPDKNKAPDAVARFRELAKAVEVLEDPKQRELYDYYLDHPREYYKVTGQYYFEQLPQADVRMIAVGLIIALSILFYVVQSQRHDKVVKYLIYATVNNLPVKAGGTKQTMELFQRAVAQYEDTVKEETSGGKSPKAGSGAAVKTGKMQKDPVFIRIVQKMVSEIQIEGGYRKPTFQDIFAVRIVMFPWHLYKWALGLYKRNFAQHQLSDQEKLELCIDRVGAGLWQELTDAEQQALIARQVWLPEVHADWMAEKEAEWAVKRPGQFKKYQRYMKKMQ